MDIINKENIAAVNDRLRSTFQGTSGDQILITQGVEAAADTRAVLRAVMGFSTFNRDNDPHGEHDFGAVEVDGEWYFL